MTSYRPLNELIPAHWTQGRMTTRDGVEIAFTRTGGEKSPLLLLHGFQASGLCWLRTAMALEADFDVLMMDARGHGRSGAPTTGFSPEQLANDVVDLLAFLEWRNPIVMGHSNGAVVGAMAFLMRFVKLWMRRSKGSRFILKRRGILW